MVRVSEHSKLQVRLLSFGFSVSVAQGASTSRHSGNNISKMLFAWINFPDFPLYLDLIFRPSNGNPETKISKWEPKYLHRNLNRARE